MNNSVPFFSNSHISLPSLPFHVGILKRETISSGYSSTYWFIPRNIWVYITIILSFMPNILLVERRKKKKKKRNWKTQRKTKYWMYERNLNIAIIDMKKFHISLRECDALFLELLPENYVFCFLLLHLAYLIYEIVLFGLRRIDSF